MILTPTLRRIPRYCQPHLEYRFDSNSVDLSASEFEVPNVQLSLAWGNQTGQNDPITP